MTRSRLALAACASLAITVACLAQDAPAPPDPAVAAAERRLAERPDSPERLYNLGVALYRAGDRTKAAERFREAAMRSSSPALAAKAMYNEGVAAYADAVGELERQQANPEGGEAPAEGASPLDRLTDRVESAFTHFRDASIADPDDREARANAENARELLRLLKQAQQQQDQQQQDQQQQDQQKQDQQKQDQQKQDQQKQDQQKQDQQAKSGGDEPPSSDRNPQGGLDRSDAPPPEGPPKPAAAEASPGTMTKEEAERVLQAVRDRERARRAALAEKAKAERARTPPARKDW